jgi:hypothetical protein
VQINVKRKRRLCAKLLRWHPEKVPGCYEDELLEADVERIMHPLHPKSNSGPSEVVKQFVQGTVERKRRLRTELLRWHPDKFQGRYGAALLEADRQRIMHRVQAICEALNTASQS